MYRSLSRRRLIFVTGKGGVGKSTFVTSLGMHLASMGRRVLLAEVDNAKPTLGGYFDRPIGFEPVRVAVNLDAINIDFLGALRSFLFDAIPVERLVKLILRNRIVRTFLVATPGAREMVVLGRVRRLAQLTRDRHDDEGWDHLIVDMPASGHAVSTLSTPVTARKLFKVGPIRKEAEQLLAEFNDPEHVALVMVSISEEMSINETLETMAKVRAAGWPPLAGVVLNRFPRVAFDATDAGLLGQVGASVDAPAGDGRAFGDTGLADRGPGNAPVVLEAASASLIEARRSAEALRRLEHSTGGAVQRLPFVPGGSVEVAHQLAEIIGQNFGDEGGAP